MSLFRMSRRFTERTAQRKLFSPPKRIDCGATNKERNLLKKRGKDVKRFNETRRNITYQGYSVTKDVCVPNEDISDTTRANTQSIDTISDNVLANHKVFEIPEVKPRQKFLLPYIGVKLLAKRTDQGGPVRQSGGRFGKLDAANEAGFFHKSDRERLMDLKKKLKDKEQGSDAPKQN